MLNVVPDHPVAKQAFTGRIAIVSHSHPSLSKGGSEIAAYTLFQGLRDLGLDAILISACAQNDRARLALGSDREIPIFYPSAIYDHFYHLGSPLVAAQLMAILLSRNIDVVNFHHFFLYGLDALRSAAAHPSLRVILTLHEFLAICNHHGQMVTRPGKALCEASSPQACHTCFPEHTRQQFALRKHAFQNAFAGVDGFVSPSRFLADRFIAWGLPSSRIAVIENGLMHRPAPAPAMARDPTLPWVFGFFGQINPFKGIETILRAVEQIARTKGLTDRIQIALHGNVIGQSDGFAARLEQMLGNHPFLTYTGPYDNKMVSKLMAACDYILVPSLWWENSPVVIQEAYAAGRPVICTGIGGMAEKIANGVSGLHFRHADPADLVRALTTAANASTYEHLCAGIPPVQDAAGMAHAYLATFAENVEQIDLPEQLLLSAALDGISV